MPIVTNLSVFSRGSGLIQGGRDRNVGWEAPELTERCRAALGSRGGRERLFRSFARGFVGLLSLGKAGACSLESLQCLVGMCVSELHSCSWILV